MYIIMMVYLNEYYYDGILKCILLWWYS